MKLTNEQKLAADALMTAEAATGMDPREPGTMKLAAAIESGRLPSPVEVAAEHGLMCQCDPCKAFWAARKQRMAGNAGVAVAEVEHCPACGSANVEMEHEVMRPEPDCNFAGGRFAYLRCRACGELAEMEHLHQSWEDYRGERED